MRVHQNNQKQHLHNHEPTRPRHKHRTTKHANNQHQRHQHLNNTNKHLPQERAQHPATPNPQIPHHKHPRANQSTHQPLTRRTLPKAPQPNNQLKKNPNLQKNHQIKLLDINDTNARQKLIKQLNIILQIKDLKTQYQQQNKLRVHILAKNNKTNLTTNHQQLTNLKQKIPIITPKQHVTHTHGNNLEHALNTHINNLHTQKTQQQHKTKTNNLQHLHEAHQQITQTNIDKKKPLHQLTPHTRRELEHTLPPKPLLQNQPPTKNTHTQHNIQILTINKQINNQLYNQNIKYLYHHLLSYHHINNIEPPRQTTPHTQAPNANMNTLNMLSTTNLTPSINFTITSIT